MYTGGVDGSRAELRSDWTIGSAWRSVVHLKVVKTNKKQNKKQSRERNVAMDGLLLRHKYNNWQAAMHSYE